MSQTHEEMIAVIQAHKEGETVEFRQRARSQWLDCREPIWDFSDFDYRIKPTPPKPREWQISPISPPSEIAHTDPPVQYGVITGPRLDGRFMTVREVLPEEQI